MSLKAKFVTTIIGLVLGVAVFLYAFISGAVVIGGGTLDIYPNGTDWVCVVGFALLSLPAIFEIVKTVTGSIKKTNKYYDEHKNVTVSYDEDGDVEDVHVSDMSTDKSYAALLAAAMGAIVVWFAGFFLAVGFTVYRIGVLIYCIVKLKGENKKEKFQGDKNHSVDTDIDPRKNIFRGVENIGQPVKISSKSLLLLQSPTVKQFTPDWTFNLQNKESIRIFLQGITIVVTGNDREYSQMLYVVRVAEDCPAVDKRRGDFAFFLLTYVQNGKKSKMNLYFLQGEGERIAGEYFKKNVVTPDNRQIYSQGKYPMMIPGKDGGYCSILPLATGKYGGDDYMIAVPYEHIEGIADNQTFIFCFNPKAKAGQIVLRAVTDEALFNKVFQACFSQFA